MTEKTTLLEFPTQFVIKVFGPNTADFINDIKMLTLQSCEQCDTPTFSEHLSSNQKYVSISITIYVTSKDNLDNVYQALTSHSQVKMVL